MAFLAIISIVAGFLIGTLLGRYQKNPEAVTVNPPSFLIVATTLGFFGLIAMLYVWPIAEGSKDIIQVMIGTVGAKWGDQVAYHFNSSAGSARKTEMMGASTTETTSTPNKVVTVTTPNATEPKP